MTPAEIIALARAQFGELTALTVSAQDARDMLNGAILELYEDLPPSRLKNLLTVTAVALTSGKGSIDPLWDKVIEVYVDDNPAFLVDRAVIAAHDYSQFFTSPTPIAHVDDDSVWVRPTTGVCSVLHLDPPEEVTAANEGTEYSSVSDVWHPALADLVTAAMYAQEEDITQMEAYRASYMQRLGMLLKEEPVA